MSDPFRMVHERSMEIVKGRSLLRPDRLLHFTGYLGLLGILEKKEIWLSRARSLNDALEIEHGLSVAIGCIGDVVSPSRREEKEILDEALRMP